MAKLKASQRAELPAKEFGLPEKARSPDAKKETGNTIQPDSELLVHLEPVFAPFLAPHA